MFRSTWPLLAAATITLSAAGSVSAADPVSVEVNGARLLKLDAPASDVVIGNPNVADVTVQTPNQLVVIGRMPGVTRLIVMSDGTVSLDAQVVVSAMNASAQVSVFASQGGPITETEYACASNRCTLVSSNPVTGGGGGAGATGGGDGSIPTEPTVDQIPPGTPGGGGGGGGGSNPSY
jgi:hypothetical protein